MEVKRYVFSKYISAIIALLEARFILNVIKKVFLFYLAKENQAFKQIDLNINLIDVDLEVALLSILDKKVNKCEQRQIKFLSLKPNFI